MQFLKVKSGNQFIWVSVEQIEQVREYETDKLVIVTNTGQAIEVAPESTAAVRDRLKLE